MYSLLFKAPCPSHDEGYNSNDGVEIDTFLVSSAPSYEFVCSSFSRWCFHSLKGSVNLRDAIIYGISVMDKYAQEPKTCFTEQTFLSVQGAYIKSLHLTMY